MQFFNCNSVTRKTHKTAKYWQLKKARKVWKKGEKKWNRCSESEVGKPKPCALCNEIITGFAGAWWKIAVLIQRNDYRISRPIRHTPPPTPKKKCDLNSTCVLCAEGKHYFQTYKYPYIYYTALSWDSEICFQIMRYGITACERLTFLFGDLPQRIHCITCDSGYLRCCSSKV